MRHGTSLSRTTTYITVFMYFFFKQLVRRQTRSDQAVWQKLTLEALAARYILPGIGKLEQPGLFTRN
jgi:hypothetical protein